MKAEELRIGNWVYIEDKPQNLVSGDIDAKVTYLFDPIPLTPEILKACSVRTKPYSYWKQEYDVHNILYVLSNESYADNDCVFQMRDDAPNEEGGKFFYIVNGIYWGAKYEPGQEPIEGAFRVVEVSYLHQLQNLFFALTGEELKIELNENILSPSQTKGLH